MTECAESSCLTKSSVYPLCHKLQQKCSAYLSLKSQLKRETEEKVSDYWTEQTHSRAHTCSKSSIPA